MSGTISKTVIIGNLGADPETRTMPNGTLVANLNVATSESWKDKKTGDRVERTEWHRVVIFGKLAEIAEKYLHKGSKVYLEGQNKTRKWQHQDGTDRYSTEIIARELTMLDGAKRNGGETSPQAQAANAGADPQPAPPANYDDDAIPF